MDYLFSLSEKWYEQYAAIIVSEFKLPDEQKTVKTAVSDTHVDMKKAFLALELYASVRECHACCLYCLRAFGIIQVVGGTAGGTKYIAQGILFKIYLDAKIADDPPLYMYGGCEPRDDYSMKVFMKKS